VICDLDVWSKGRTPGPLCDTLLRTENKMEIESRNYKPKSGGSGYREAPADDASELQPIHHGPTSFEIELAEHEPIGIVYRFQYLIIIL